MTQNTSIEYQSLFYLQVKQDYDKSQQANAAVNSTFFIEYNNFLVR